MILESFSIYNNDSAREARVREARLREARVREWERKRDRVIPASLSEVHLIFLIFAVSSAIKTTSHSFGPLQIAYSCVFIHGKPCIHRTKGWNAFHCNRKGNEGWKRTHAPRTKIKVWFKEYAPVNFCLNDYYMALTSYVASDGVHIFCRFRFTMALNLQMRSRIKSGISFDKPNRLTFPVCQIHCASLEMYTLCYRQVIAIHTLKWNSSQVTLCYLEIILMKKTLFIAWFFFFHSLGTTKANFI